MKKKIFGTRETGLGPASRGDMGGYLYQQSLCFDFYGRHIRAGINPAATF